MQILFMSKIFKYFLHEIQQKKYLVFNLSTSNLRTDLTAERVFLTGQIKWIAQSCWNIDLD